MLIPATRFWWDEDSPTVSKIAEAVARTGGGEFEEHLKMSDGSVPTREEQVAYRLQRTETPFLRMLAAKARKVRGNLASQQHLLQSLDGLLEHFDWLASQPEVTKDAVAELLVARVHANLNASIYLILSGFWGQVMLGMRDFMEVEYLVKHFRHNPADERIWLSDRKARKNKFNANTLRQKEAARQGIAVKSLRDAADYAAHSELLHVAPELAGASRLVSKHLI